MSADKFIYSLVITLLAITVPNLSFACSCAMQNPEEYFEQADYVFSAIVISTKLASGSRTEPSQSKSPNWSSMHEVNVFFDPIENFKGDSADLAHLTTAISEATCGVSMWPGQSWIFFVLESGFVSLCDGSHQYYPSSTKARSLRILRDTHWLKEASNPPDKSAHDAGEGSNSNSQR